MKRLLFLVILFCLPAVAQDLTFGPQWDHSEGYSHGGQTEITVNSVDITLWVACTDMVFPCVAHAPTGCDPAYGHQTSMTLVEGPLFIDGVQKAKYHLVVKGMTWGEELILIPWTRINPYYHYGYSITGRPFPSL